MKTFLTSKNIFYILAILFVVIIILFEQFGFFSSYHARVEDKLLPTREVSDRIVLVTIDDKSIQALEVWPWSRDIHASIIDMLSEKEAAVIGYDVTFSEQSREEEDLVLEEAIRSSQKVVLASEATIALSNNIPKSIEGLLPLSRFALEGSFGVTTLVRDGDGVIRRTPLIVERDGNEEKAFAVRIAESFGAEGEWRELLGEGQVYRIPFVAAPSSFKSVSAIDVLNDQVSEDLFKNRIVLVGATAADLHDMHLTPSRSGELMSGVELQANIVQSLLEGKRLQSFSFWNQVVLYLILALLVGFFFARIRLRLGILFSVFLLCTYIVFANILSLYYLIAPVFYPSLLILGISVIAIAYRYYLEKKKRRWIHNAFGKYLAPQVVERLVSGEHALKLGGDKVELTLLFSDIRAFTSLSEKLNPEQLVSLLNTYLAAMTKTVHDTEGVLDKYIGDAIMAFWGAPLSQDDQAVRAAKTALVMKGELSVLNNNWSKEGLPTLNIGIGVHTGDVIVGNIGSEDRFDYTAIGDDVNLASRIEGLTKYYKVMILISETTKKNLPIEFITRIVDQVVVKGRTEPVRLYELVGLYDDLSDIDLESALAFEKAYDLYRVRKWNEAMLEFAKLADKKDALSKLYMERCEQMKKDDPGEEWDGVYVAKSK